jgi:hypothetical protein
MTHAVSFYLISVNNSRNYQHSLQAQKHKTHRNLVHQREWAIKRILPIKGKLFFILMTFNVFYKRELADVGKM